MLLSLVSTYSYRTKNEKPYEKHVKTKQTFIEYSPVEDGDEEGDGVGRVVEDPEGLYIPRQAELGACNEEPTIILI